MDALYLWEVEDLLAYWGEHPPLHILVGALRWLGAPGGARPFKQSSEDEIQGLVQQFNATR